MNNIHDMMPLNTSTTLHWTVVKDNQIAIHLCKGHIVNRDVAGVHKR